MPVVWTSKEQNVVALPTAEAEYREMAEVLRRAVYKKTFNDRLAT